jgi:hypothetical protein
MHGTELEKAGFLAPVKSPLSRSNGAQYVTPDGKIYCETVKMCRFSSGNWFFCLKFVQLAVVSERRNTVVHLQKRV